MKVRDGEVYVVPDERAPNDAYAWIDRGRGDAARLARTGRNGEAARVSDEAVAQIMTAAIRLYVAKSDGEERTFRPIAGQRTRS